MSLPSTSPAGRDQSLGGGQRAVAVSRAWDTALIDLEFRGWPWWQDGMPAVNETGPLRVPFENPWQTCLSLVRDRVPVGAEVAGNARAAEERRGGDQGPI